MRRCVRDQPPSLASSGVALSGILYRAFAETLEDDPVDAKVWKHILSLNKEAMEGPLLRIGDESAAIARKLGVGRASVYRVLQS
jgi:hypothetical protein